MPIQPFFQKDGFQGPGTHAFIVGVSDYTNLPEPGVLGGNDDLLGLKKLNSPALSAWRVYEWLLKNETDLPQRLASVHLLLAPSSKEKDAEPALRGEFISPVWDNFAKAVKAWRLLACSDPQNVTFFYFSGHGAQFRRENVVMLMQDFGDEAGAPLNNAVELSNIVNGMAPGAPPPSHTVARTQLYFVDACRGSELADVARGEEDVPSVFREVIGKDDRNRPILFATVDGELAIGRAGKVSYFCEALLQALDTACDFSRDEGATSVWPVTIESVRYSLQSQFLKLKLTQKPFLQNGSTTDLEIRLLKEPPTYDLIITLDPEACVGTTELQILNADDVPVATFPVPGCDYPYRVSLPMGVYDIVATGPSKKRVKKVVILNQRQQNPVRILIP